MIFPKSIACHLSFKGVPFPIVKNCKHLLEFLWPVVKIYKAPKEFLWAVVKIYKPSKEFLWLVVKICKAPKEFLWLVVKICKAPKEFLWAVVKTYKASKEFLWAVVKIYKPSKEDFHPIRNRKSQSEMNFRIASFLAVVLLLAADYGYFFYGLSIWWLALILFVYLNLLVLGAIYIGWNFYFKSFNKGKNPQQIALTFDDGPATETQAILDILKKEGVEAAFFIIGKNAAAKPELVKRMFAEGHVVGNHSYNHGFNFDWQTSKKMQSELEHTNQLVHKITGKLPKLFRPPYGVTNPNLAKAVSSTGMHSIGWSLRSFDTKAKDSGLLLNKLLKDVKGGDIILLHDSMIVTREILTQFITDARKKGFTFVRVDKMLALEAYA